jgi:hypothetical protein
VSDQLHAPAALPPGERAPGTHWIRGWVGHCSRSGRRGEEKILDPTGTRTLPFGRPARSQSLCWLRYPGSECWHWFGFTFSAIRNPFISPFAMIGLGSTPSSHISFNVWKKEFDLCDQLKEFRFLTESFRYTVGLINKCVPPPPPAALTLETLNFAQKNTRFVRFL